MAPCWNRTSDEALLGLDISQFRTVEHRVEMDEISSGQNSRGRLAGLIAVVRIFQLEAALFS
jgi:hypothetical protein